MTGELPLDLFFQPLSGLMVLTSGAMAGWGRAMPSI